MPDSNWLSGQGLNLQGAGMQNQAQLQGAAALQDASQIPFANLQNLYGLGTTQQQAPWNQLGQYANLLYPQANLGQGQTQTDHQHQRSRAVTGAHDRLGGAAEHRRGHPRQHELQRQHVAVNHLAGRMTRCGTAVRNGEVRLMQAFSTCLRQGLQRMGPGCCFPA